MLVTHKLGKDLKWHYTSTLTIIHRYGAGWILLQKLLSPRPGFLSLPGNLLGPGRMGAAHVQVFLPLRASLVRGFKRGNGARFALWPFQWPHFGTAQFGPGGPSGKCTSLTHYKWLPATPGVAEEHSLLATYRFCHKAESQKKGSMQRVSFLVTTVGTKLAKATTECLDVWWCRLILMDHGCLCLQFESTGICCFALYSSETWLSTQPFR